MLFTIEELRMIYTALEYISLYYTHNHSVKKGEKFKKLSEEILELIIAEETMDSNTVEP